MTGNQRWARFRIASAQASADGPFTTTTVGRRFEIELRRERYALPFFCDSNIDWPVAAVPTTVGPDKPPKYPTTWYTDYMVWYQKRNYDAVYPQAAE